MIHRALLAAVGLASSSLAACSSDVDSGSGPSGVTVRVLTANIGNRGEADPRYPLRLSYQACEDYLAQRIAALHEDVAFLQEVLPSLDDGFDFSQLPGGTKFSGQFDHAAILRELTMNP